MIYDPENNVFINKDDQSINAELPQVIWHITDICPSGCLYCFSPKTNLSVDIKVIPYIIDLLKRLQVQKVDISGGEPLTFSYFPMIVEGFNKADIYLTLTTSGAGTKSNIKFLVNNLKCFTRVIISVDGPNEFSHNSLRKNKELWEKILIILDNISDAEKKVHIRINTVITKPFVVNNWILPMVNYIESIGVREWCLIQPHPANEKSDFKSYDITTKEFWDVYETAKSLISNTKVIYREIKMYSTYWVLYPNGLLCQHSNTSQDGVAIDLLKLPYNKICALIRNKITLLPF